MRRNILMLLAVSAFAVTTASAATVSKNFPQTAQVNLKATPSGCENNPGPYVTIDGEMKLSGLQARIILSNNTKLTHYNSADVAADVVLIPAGESITIAKQPSRGGVGGNPWIYFVFTSPSGSELCAPIKLGRCVQGLTNAGGAFQIPTSANMTVNGGGCENSGGPFVTLNGEIRLGGLSGKIILTNNAKFTHATSADVVLEVVLLEDGKSITFAKQPPLDGVTGNPIIWLQFLSGSGSPIGSAINLGRCNQAF